MKTILILTFFTFLLACQTIKSDKNSIAGKTPQEALKNYLSYLSKTENKELANFLEVKNFNYNDYYLVNNIYWDVSKDTTNLVTSIIKNYSNPQELTAIFENRGLVFASARNNDPLYAFNRTNCLNTEFTDTMGMMRRAGFPGFVNDPLFLPTIIRLAPYAIDILAIKINEKIKFFSLSKIELSNGKILLEAGQELDKENLYSTMKTLCDFSTIPKK